VQQFVQMMRTRTGENLASGSGFSLSCCFPGWQWVDRLLEQMPLAPVTFASRCKQAFGIVSIDPLAGVYQLHDLIEETFSLVETHLSELDTTQARAWFQERRRVWESVPRGILEES
jgi:hypothetical protein